MKRSRKSSPPVGLPTHDAGAGDAHSGSAARASTPTIREIAARVGVSNQVVSMVLNGGRSSVRASEKTRTKILHAAAALGYRPNASARAIREGQTRAIALLLSAARAHSNLPASMLDGVHDELQDHDYHLMIAKLPDEKLTNEGFVPKLLRQWMVDGLLVNYHYDIPERMKRLILDHQIPSIWINSKQEYDCVYPDDFSAGKAATQLLLERGHRRIAYVDYAHTLADAGEHYSAQDRCSGYREAMRDAGLSQVVVRRPDDPGSPDRVQRIVSLLKQSDRPTAFIGYSQHHLWSAWAAALTLGLRVPADVSLVAFGDASVDYLGLTVTTLVVPQTEVGRVASRMILQKISQPGTTIAPAVVPFTAAPGDSVVAPALAR
jgi:LacI family transcriptional regulator